MAPVSIVVLIGGVRSGKSAAAARLAAQRPGGVTVIVGPAPRDPEMARRVEAHLRDRPSEWHTVEVSDADGLRRALARADGCAVLDCLTSLVSRVVERVLTDHDGPTLDGDQEQTAADLVDELLAVLRSHEGDLVIVTNEVGAGVVPAHPAGRLFRDLAGRANAAMVASADAAWLTVAGRCLELHTHGVDATWPEEDR